MLVCTMAAQSRWYTEWSYRSLEHWLWLAPSQRWPRALRLQALSTIGPSHTLQKGRQLSLAGCKISPDNIIIFSCPKGLLNPGWITVFAWQATAASLNFLIAAQIQGLVVLNFPDSYASQRWHGTLLIWAITLVVLSVNVWCIKILPVIELIAGICHVAFFIALLVTLVVLAPKSSPDFVFTRLINDQSGWTNPGISWCLGLLTVTWCFVGRHTIHTIFFRRANSVQALMAQSI